MGHAAKATHAAARAVGSKARLWHWNGTRFIASAWKQGNACDHHGTRRNRQVRLLQDAIRQLVCLHSGGPVDRPVAVVVCGIKSGLKPAPPRHTCTEGGYAGDRVYLNETGRTVVPPCAGDPGALVGEPQARVLGYGESWTGGGLRCTSAMAGLTSTRAATAYSFAEIVGERSDADRRGACKSACKE